MLIRHKLKHYITLWKYRHTGNGKIFEEEIFVMLMAFSHPENSNEYFDQYMDVIVL